MNRTIWTCWFQGREGAPSVVRKCLRSWELKNPGWEFRCLDAQSVERYVPLGPYVDLTRQALTAASLSDVVRILLLHEFGGVWVDATLFCHRPLDAWLPGVMEEGFFAFAEPAPDRPLSSWFLAGESHSYLLTAWAARVVDYWTTRARSDDYFWLHHLFRELCATDRQAAAAWSRVPKISANGPHAAQVDQRGYRDKEQALAATGRTPVFKLTYRTPEGLTPGTLAAHLLDGQEDASDRPPHATAPLAATDGTVPRRFAALKVSTENLGDHIQIEAGLRLLQRIGVVPSAYIDRDNEIRSAPELDAAPDPVGLLLNGWFKTNRSEWPPHPKLAPLIYGFHIRLFQCPELVSDESIAFFRRHQPVGCRDAYTRDLLRSKGVDAFTSHCLSLTFPRRIDDPSTQTETFVVSRDERIKRYIPESLGPYTFVSHYSGSNHFGENMTRAGQLLAAYRDRARLVVTTLLHCALPAIAMGIPTVVFYPLNDERAHASDRERFSSLVSLVPIYLLADRDGVEWRPKPVDVGALKREILDGFYAAAARWRAAPPAPLGPIAPPSVLPPP